MRALGRRSDRCAGRRGWPARRRRSADRRRSDRGPGLRPTRPAIRSARCGPRHPAPAAASRAAGCVRPSSSSTKRLGLRLTAESHQGRSQHAHLLARELRIDRPSGGRLRSFRRPSPNAARSHRASHACSARSSVLNSGSTCSCRKLPSVIWSRAISAARRTCVPLAASPAAVAWLSSNWIKA